MKTLFYIAAFIALPALLFSAGSAAIDAGVSRPLVFTAGAFVTVCFSYHIACMAVWGRPWK
jgi:hypothetical protein